MLCFTRKAHAENEREWTRDIWNHWFDEVFPPTPIASDESSEEDEEEEEEEDPFQMKEEEKLTSVAVTSRTLLSC